MPQSFVAWSWRCPDDCLPSTDTIHLNAPQSVLGASKILPALDGHDPLECAAERARRIEDMAASLIEMFGDSALAVTLGQPGRNDVCGDSGICWKDLTAVLRTARHGLSGL